ncbi:MAG: sugar phosphate isomerase/epimerase [Planctomycetes bacterium]|nr:sugar phosphate isomerase/epimerase [Planctomycetota bacterium]
MPRLDRRRLFQVSALAASGAALGVAANLPAPRIARAETYKEPRPRAFRLSLAAYSFRDALPNAQQPGVKKPRAGTMSLEDFIRYCGELGLAGTELTSYYFPAEITREYLLGLKQLAFRQGLSISGTAIANDFCLPAGPERSAQMEYTKRWIDYAETMGAPVIRVFSGKALPGKTPDETAANVETAHRLAVEGFEEACDYAGKHGVFLALENHGGLTTEAEGLLRLARDVKSPWFGVNLDSGNFASDDPYRDLAKIAPHAINVQIKMTVHRPGAKPEATDLKRLAQILRTCNYRGFVVLEYEEKEDPRETVPRIIDEMKEVFG